MVKKHELIILSRVNDDLKSTRQIVRETEKATGKVINWSQLYRILRELEDKNLIERFETIAGILWKKK